ncbi:5-oxoprolinase subunit C family protein [Sediminicola luteus]|uniref:Carboxyltransferase domain-containing protein n=1 Tax=Sediminicola luteus TaxID=319238 RepID=A0A2A4G7S4_9FLAO|nr:biotin-dependent carboxyltransferase family protein [Sediminicola luteus]PCE64030.1 hypothetical protein B7P33_12350 [Sediminicola luteus]
MLEVIHPGLYTSLQDMGRYGFREIGVPVSGAMDQLSLGLLNKIIGNTPKMAAMEMTLLGPKLRFQATTRIIIGGAPIQAELEGRPVPMGQLTRVRMGEELHFGSVQQGCRSYLLVKGGFQVKKVLKSSSQYFPLTDKGFLRKRMTVGYKTFDREIPMKTAYSLSHLEESILEVYRGPEFELLASKDLERLFFRPFHLAKEQDRMGIQLQEPLTTHDHSLLTSAVLPGTVQYTPSGKLIVLMRDGQTTGGYPRVLQLSERAISVLAQKRVGDSIRLKLLR